MEYTRITSRQNPLVRRARALGDSGEKREEAGVFLCEGARLCADAASSGLTVETAFFTEKALLKYEEYCSPLSKAAKEAYIIEEHVALLLADTKTTQGVFCLCEVPKGLKEEAQKGEGERACLVLENLQDPGNMGTVLRTAEALGVGLIYLLGECCDPLSPKVMRASMGAVFRLKIGREKSPEKLCERLTEAGYELHAAVPHRDARRVTETDFSTGRHAVFIGNEGNGLTDKTVSLCAGRVTIPMAGRAESLNASAAATILLWELQRKAPKEPEAAAHG